MLRRFRLFSFLLVALVFTENPGRPLRAREDDPFYEGKRISEWVFMLNGSDPAAQALAEAMLQNIGPPAVPKLSCLLKDKSEHVREAAARILGGMPSTTQSVLPALIDALDDQSEQVRCAAGMSLCNFVDDRSKDDVPTLRKALDNKDPCVRKLVACALARTRHDASPRLVARLIEALKHKDPGVQAQALIALEAVGPAARAALPALHDAWKCADDSGTQLDAVMTISRVDPKSQRTHSLLKTTSSRLIKELHEEKNPLGRSLIARRLGRMESYARAAVDPLEQALRDPESIVRVAAAHALSRITPEKTSEMIRVLITLLKDKNVLVRAEAANALANIGLKAKEAITPLTDLIKAEKDPITRIIARNALKEIDPGRKRLEEKGAGKKRKKRCQEPLLK